MLMTVLAVAGRGPARAQGDPPPYVLAWGYNFYGQLGDGTITELGRRSQSSEGVPFMWVRHARAWEVKVIDDGDIARWTAAHDGYTTFDPPSLHRRSVLLDRASRSIDIIDGIEGGSHGLRLAFHHGPDVHVELNGFRALLKMAFGIWTWSGPAEVAAWAPGSLFQHRRLRPLRAGSVPCHATGIPRSPQAVTSRRFPTGQLCHSVSQILWKSKVSQ